MGRMFDQNMEISHVGFSDESHWNQGRYRSLTLISLEISRKKGVESAVRRFLNDSNVEEFKWHNVRTELYQRLAEKLLNLTIDLVCAGPIRLDILTWDIQDARHSINRRDDTANLARMYYHLLINVVERRWARSARWEMRPDERTDMDWNTLEDCLQ